MATKSQGVWESQRENIREITELLARMLKGNSNKQFENGSYSVSQ